MFFLQNLKIIPNKQEKHQFLSSLVESQSPTILSFLNAHAFTLSTKDPVFAANLAASTYVLRDGIGIKLLLRLLGREAGLNMNGTDLIPEIMSVFKGKKVALCGTAEPWLSQAAGLIRDKDLDVILQIDGFQPTHTYQEAVAASQPDLVILAMGMPKQEEVAVAIANSSLRPLLVVNGGAILDFMAGKVPRAPLFWRQMHLEWFYRLIREPRRLARRYILGGLEFCLLALRLKFFSSKEAS